MTQVLNVLPVIGHPRDSKRITMLQSAELEVRAIAFERNYFGGRPPSCAVSSMGTVSNGKYMKRMFQMVLALPKLRRAILESQVVYASGVDMAAMSLLAGAWLGRPIIVEVGDIREIQIKQGCLGSLVRSLEKMVVSRCAALICTASGFVSGYYRGLLKIDVPYQVIENKVEPIATQSQGQPNEVRSSGRIRIGYFGLLRCPWSLKFLIDLARKLPDRFEVVFAGQLGCDFDIRANVRELDNLEFLGPYKSPEGLQEIYSRVDVVWACYPPPDAEPEQWHWAQAICRSNRFYESCFFAKPLISFDSSADGEQVAKYGIGLVLSQTNGVPNEDAVAGISWEVIENWRRNQARLPRSVYEYGTEAAELSALVMSLLDSEQGGAKNGG